MRAALAHRPRARPTPRADFGSLHETLLIAGVTTILVIRTQLWLTNYPQLGGHGLHIAHLLWGGLFMLLAIGLLLTFLGRSVLRIAAVVGGVGFGFFIDELGKFVTADNNYFYRPAAALIYLIFVGLFLLTRSLQRREGDPRGTQDDVANAVELLGEAARNDLTDRERREALALLDRADDGDPLVAPLRSLFHRLPTVPPAAPAPGARAAAAARGAWNRFAASPKFPTWLSLALGAWAVLSLLEVVELVTGPLVDLGGGHPGYVSDRLGHLAFVNVASLTSSALSAALVARGAVQLHRGERQAAYRNFERALLVAILVTQVFSFVESQFGAVFGLAVDLLLLVALRTLRSTDHGAHAPAAPAPAPVAEPATVPLRPQ
jgi:hypothetical protein